MIEPSSTQVLRDLDAPVMSDDVRFEPLAPGVSYALEGRLLKGHVRTVAWNTPDDGITLRQALEFTGLSPEFWKVTHVTEHVWADAAQGGNVVAFKIRVTEDDDAAVA